MSANERLTLPSGAVAVRSRDTWREGAPTRYAFHGAPVVLSLADVEALYADSIAGDGGRELPKRPAVAVVTTTKRCLCCGHGHWYAVRA